MVWNKTQIIKYLQDDKVYIVNEYKPKRTIPQNRLYHWYFIKRLVEILNSKWISTTGEELHEELKTRFLTKRIKSKITKRYNKVTYSTTSLNTKEFKEYMERINNWFIDKTWEWVDLNITETDLLYYENLFT